MLPQSDSHSLGSVVVSVVWDTVTIVSSGMITVKIGLSSVKLTVTNGVQRRDKSTGYNSVLI